MHFLKKVIHSISHIQSILKIKKQDSIDLKFWLKNGLKLPPPEVVKHSIIIKYAKKENIVSFFGDYHQNTRFPLLKIYFEQITIFNEQNDFTSHFVSKINSLKTKSIIWIDANALLKFKTKEIILNEIAKIVKSIAHSKVNHVVLWDNAHLFLHNPDYPNLQELKTLFLNDKPAYGAMKTENNIFIMAPKL
jgi:hypothetical protein